MNVTDSLINAALLGTAAKDFVPDGLPEELLQSFRSIQQKADDPESAFYQMTAAAFAYSRAGLEPGKPQEELVSPTQAPVESKPYFAKQAGELLISLVGNRNRHLLLYAYRRAVAHDKLIPPIFLPTLLYRAFDRNTPGRQTEQAFLAHLTGERGRWLLPHMGFPTWGESGNESWETASHEERKRMLVSLREESPEKGLALLQSELKNEPAAHREELILCLRRHISKADEPFLEGIAATDRSSNVKDVARSLLCSIPDSKLVRTYWDMLRGKLRYNALMGWSYDNIIFTPEMKKLGLEEVSSHKNEKDSRFLLRQLAERVPLGFWSEFYDCSPEKAATKLAKNPPFSSLFNLSKAVAQFGDAQWAYFTLKEDQSEKYINTLMEFLTPAQREELSLKPDKEYGHIPPTWFNEDYQPWGMKFSMYAFRRITLGKNYYTSKEVAENLSVYLPVEMLRTVEQAANSDNPDQVNINFCRHLQEYMHLKKEIDTLFI